jgi:ATP-binding cassette subfamily B protein
MDADQILVMEHGRVIERGGHQELLARAGSYAQMWRLQQQEDASRIDEDAELSLTAK